MFTYNIHGFDLHPDEHGELPLPQTVMPPDIIDPKALVLRDYRAPVVPWRPSPGLVASMAAAFALIEGGVMFDEPVPPAKSRLEVLVSRFLSFTSKKQAGITRWWLWNVKFPVKDWFSWRSSKIRYRGLSRHDLYLAMLADAKYAGVLDSDMPYWPESHIRIHDVA